MRVVPILCLSAAICLAFPTEGQPQARPSVGADVALNSRYVWRGVTRRNDWVLQPDVVAAAASSSGFLTAGGWTNIEFSTASAEDPSEIGLGQTFGEWNLWGEYAWWVGPFDFSVGYARYFFADTAAAAAVGSSVFNTGELYADAGYRIGPLAPRAAAWFDFEDVKGAYFELSATYRVPVVPFAIPVLYFGGVLGLSAGQAINEEDPSEGAYFAENGLTHIDLSVQTQIYSPMGGALNNLYLTPSIHFQINHDAATRRVGGSPEDADKGSVWWFGFVLGWYK